MQNNIIRHLFSSDEIDHLVNDPVTLSNRDRLSGNPSVVKFSLPLSDNIRAVLENQLSMNLTGLTSIPMQWVRGDTPAHIDRGESAFSHTYLVYLTDSVGEFIVNGQQYPIVGGDAHIFSEGLEHSTVDTANSVRLIMGPMSETGFPVGAATIGYIPSESQQGCGFLYSTSMSSGNGTYIFPALILNLPPPIPTDSPPRYYVYYYNYTDISDNDIWAPPAGKVFGGWKLANFDGIVPIGDTPADQIYMPGETYYYNVPTTLVPNWIDAAYVPPREQLHRFGMHFTDNSIVFYKPHSLSTGGGGSGVRNSRHKQRRT